MADRKLKWAGWCAFALCVLGCGAKINGTIPAPLPKAGSGSFRAGAGIEDLTPIPGIPMAGYSMGGKIAHGTWQRLRARALYLEDAGGDAVVLVACDLDMIPNGLADRVAKLLRTKTTVEHLGRAQILLGASHTHHGPASYFTDRMYNSFTAPRSGFDEEVFDFLATRIVKAIEQAYGSSVPATLRTAPALGGPNDRLPCVFRNRSLPAFEDNPEAEVAALRSANPLPNPNPCPARCPDPLACESLHTQIDYFMAVDATNQVIGVGIFLASHATVLSPDNELFSPDFFGVTSTLLETGQAGCLAAPVVAVFNGAEGDVSPAWEPGKRDRRDVLEIARDVAKRVCTILPAAVDRPGADIAFRWSEVEPLTDRAVKDPFDRRDPWEQRTTRQPQVGAPSIGGAEDGRTMLYEMGFVEGMNGPVRDDNGSKHPIEVDMMGIRTSVAGLAAVNQPPPTQAPIGVYRLGNLALVTLPGELTTMLGERIRNYVAGKLTPAPDDRVVLMGLAGGHVSYITTPAEYEAQHYEGASNLYGAATGPLIAVEMGKLAQQLSIPAVAPTARDYSYNAGSGLRWRPRDAAGPSYDVDDGLAMLVQDLATGERKLDFPTFCFRDAVPRLSQITPDGNCQRTIPDVHIQTDLGGEVEIGDVLQSSKPGLDVVTVMTAVGQDKTTAKDATEWCGIWMVPAATPAGNYRFWIEPIVGAGFASSVFTVGGPAFFQATTEPLVPDRRDSMLCDSPLDIFNLCPEPITCQAP